MTVRVAGLLSTTLPPKSALHLYTPALSAPTDLRVSVLVVFLLGSSYTSSSPDKSCESCVLGGGKVSFVVNLVSWEEVKLVLWVILCPEKR